MIWAILTIIGFVILCLWVMAHENRTYFSPREKKGQKLYDSIMTCNSFAAWNHWRNRVLDFEKKYPTSSGWIKGLNNGLLDKASELSKKFKIMKGKLILTNISSPVESMQVVLEKVFKYNLVQQNSNSLEEGELHVQDYITEILRVEKQEKLKIWTTEGWEINDLFEAKLIKQIVVEYERDWLPEELLNEGETVYQVRDQLPLHPSDWNWAIEHIGEEVEFEEITGNAFLECNKMYAGIKRFKEKAKEPKAIHPTPVIYTEEEVLNIVWIWTDWDKETCRRWLKDNYLDRRNEYKKK